MVFIWQLGWSVRFKKVLLTRFLLGQWSQEARVPLELSTEVPVRGLSNMVVSGVEFRVVPERDPGGRCMSPYHSVQALFPFRAVV